MGWHLASRITRIFDMTFFLIILMSIFALSLCKSFCVISYYYCYYYISMSDSVFHLILLLLCHLHFGSNSQNQQINPTKSIYTRMMYFLTRRPKFSSYYFRQCKNNNVVITFLSTSSTRNGFTLTMSKNEIISKIVV